MKKKIKKISVFSVALALLASTAGYAASGGWFTSVAYVANKSLVRAASTSNAGSSEAFTVYDVGDGEFEDCSVEVLNFAGDELAAIVSCYNNKNYDEAESELIKLAKRSPNGTDEEPCGYSVVSITYEFSYDDDEDITNAFVRFIPTGSYADTVNMDGEEIFALQTLSYKEDGELIKLDRISADDQLAYYYAQELNPGDSICLVYTLLVSDEDIDSFDVYAKELLSIELIQSENNACVFMWGVLLDSGNAEMFEDDIDNSITYKGEEITLIENIDDEVVVPVESVDEVDIYIEGYINNNDGYSVIRNDEYEDEYEDEDDSEDDPSLRVVEEELRDYEDEEKEDEQEENFEDNAEELIIKEVITNYHTIPDCIIEQWPHECVSSSDYEPEYENPQDIEDEIDQPHEDELHDDY